MIYSSDQTSSEDTWHVTLLQDCLQGIKRVEGLCAALHKEQSSLSKAVKELQELVKEGQKSFTLKGSGYEVLY